MDKILIKDLSARGVIGVYEWERAEAQEIRISVTLFISLRAAGVSDDLADSVDYHALTNRLLAYVEGARPRTVEALAESLARLCLVDERVERVLLRVEKPAAIRFASSVGVEIERSRQDYG